MATCPYALVERAEDVLCEKFGQATGFNCYVLRNVECTLHMEAGGWDVPLEDVPQFPAQIRARIAGRLMHGDCPLYSPNPVDIVDAAKKLKVLLTREQLTEFLPDMVEQWARQSKKPGGHPAAVAELKAREVAKVWDMEAELDAWAETILA